MRVAAGLDCVFVKMGVNGACDGEGITENHCGSGKVVWGKSLSQVLRELGTPPDFSCHGQKVGEGIRYIHRTIDGDDL